MEEVVKRANELMELMNILMQRFPIRPILKRFLAAAALAKRDQAFQALGDQEP